MYGFEPIETPSMENIETLTGKYGDEGDQLIYRILNSGNYLNVFEKEGGVQEAVSKGEKTFSPKIAEKALRYDLTVPFARFVTMNRNELPMPFRRYQVQPVWRADRPQKGRYREFYQCDADVIGSDSLTNELDLIALIRDVFTDLKLPATLKLNNRKLLSALSEKINAASSFNVITIAIDKLDKIGKEAVLKEIAAAGIDETGVQALSDFISSPDDAAGKFDYLKNYFSATPSAAKGLEELEFLMRHINELKLGETLNIEIDPTLARGLSYYTGTIFEAKAATGTFTGSILGGGRYDDLTGIFGMPGLSGVGISFGIDRICDVMEEAGLFPESISKSFPVRVLFVHFDELSRDYCLRAAGEFRSKGISCEVYPDISKIKKQFDFANRLNIPYVCIAGSNEMANHAFTMKNMTSGEQREMQTAILLEYFSKNE
jgi:histidyl-tRNA synthetase